MHRYVRSFLAAILLGGAVAAGPASASGSGAPPPNFLVIVVDDLGFSDIGAFGGEISTPNLNRIAKRGVRLSDFHVAPTCSPTRAMLLTGQDPHTVGLGTMAELPMPGARPKGYEGYLNGAPTIAARLRDAGYSTLMAGKWHLGTKPGQWPADNGFDHSFALLEGAGSHYGLDQHGQWVGTGMETSYSSNDRPGQMPVGTYTADTFTNKMLAFLRDQEASKKPFFAYLAFTEPHWPLQAPAALVAKYHGRYDAGPVALRAERMARMKKMGLIPADAKPAPMEGPEWSTLQPEERARFARSMEIYAAMVERVDANVGRVLEQLRREGRLDSTVILFMSDNGASGSEWEELRSLLGMMKVPPALLAKLEKNNEDLTRMGGPESFVTYGSQWPQSAMAPARLFKGFTTEGGILAPAFIAGPGIPANKISHALLSVRDVLPTLLTLAKVPGPEATEEGGGRSWLPLLTEQSNAVRTADDVLVTELFGRRMVLRGDGWKAIYSDPGARGLRDVEARWQLYQTKDDPAEMNDLATSRPAILNELIATWGRYAKANNIHEEIFRVPSLDQK